MEKQITTIHVQKSLLDFQCIGSDCEDNCCCYDWKISVDKKHYKAYKKVKDPLVRSTLQATIKRDKQSTSEQDYAYIQQNSSGVCPLLNESQLCTIHLKYGTGMLCHTCRQYPKRIAEIEGEFWEFGDLSCPEIARYMLLSTDKIEFVKQKRNKQTYRIDDTLRLPDPLEKRRHHLIQQFAITVLQNRAYPFHERICFLGCVLEKLNTVDVHHVKSLEEELSKQSRQIVSRGILHVVEDAALQCRLSVLPQYIEQLCQSIDLRTNVRMKQCLDEYQQGMKVESGHIALETYQNIQQVYYQPFLQKNSHMLEQYAVNHIVTSLFPTSSTKYMDLFALLVIELAILQLFLVGIAGYHKKLEPVHVVKLIQTYHKSFQHSANYRQFLILILQDCRQHLPCFQNFLSVMV